MSTLTMILAAALLAVLLYLGFVIWNAFMIVWTVLGSSIDDDDDADAEEESIT